MIIAHLTITSTENVIDRIEEYLPTSFKNLVISFSDGMDDDIQKFLYLECINSDKILDKVVKLSKSFPDEIIFTHCFADIGCSYHTVESEIKNGTETVTLDEYDPICD